jgi:hypothetical protein
MKKITSIIIACGLLALATQQAGAVAQLRLSDGTTTVTIVDEGLGDAAVGIPGAVEYVGPVGPNWYLDVTVGSAYPVIGAPTAPAMDIGTANNSIGSGTLTIDFTDTGFSAGGAADFQVGGNTAGAVAFSVWTDPTNLPFAKTTQITTLGPLVGGIGGSFTGVAGGVVSTPAPYSMTMEAVIQHTVSGHTGFDAALTVTPPQCNCTLTFTSPASITICEGDAIPDVTATQDCGTPVIVTLAGSVTNDASACPQIITRTNTAVDGCGVLHTFVQTVTQNCLPVCTITTSVTSTFAGTTGLHAWVADAGPGATYSWHILNGTITAGDGTPNITFTAGPDTTVPISITVKIINANGCQNNCTAGVSNVPNPPACTITGVTISDTSWNKFNIPSGTSPNVWVHAHIGALKGIPTTGVTTVQFVNVSISLNGTPYALPDGVMIFDSSAPATISTTYNGGKWITTVNPNNMSDEMFFTGAAIPVTPAIAAGAKATLTYTTVASVQGISFSWQWSAAVYTFWPADWNQALIQPFHGNGLHAGTPLNTKVQKSLIQGPRCGGGSNFTGSWSATGNAACQ